MGNSLEQALKKCDFGGAYAPLFASFNAFLRLLTPHRLAGKGCQSGAERFLKVLGGASLSPIRRTSKPAEFQRVLCVYFGLEKQTEPKGNHTSKEPSL